MCPHREHRTGNCRVCTPNPGIRGLLPPPGQLQERLDAGRAATKVDMPHVWEGDDS